MARTNTNFEAAVPAQAHNPSSPHPYTRRFTAGIAAGLLLFGLSGCGNSDDTNPTESLATSIIDNEPNTQIPNAYNLDAMTFSDDPTILQLAEPLQTSDEEKRLVPKGITLHWWSFSSGGDIEELRKVLASNSSCGDNGCAVQYAITQDGSIYRMMKSPTEFATHARGANETTFGIEIEGTPEDFATNGDKFNERKFEAVVSLTRELVNDFDLPVEGEVICDNVSGIHGHHEYNNCRADNTTKNDVGEAYTAAVINAVKSMDPAK